MTELGQTDDPRALVPGHLATVEADAVTLGDHGRRVGEAGRRLLDVRVDGWGGQAGPRFAHSWSRQPPAWFHLADALGQASRSLDRYLAMLTWAQGEAAAAIELWNRGVAATGESEARSGYQSAGDREWRSGGEPGGGRSDPAGAGPGGGKPGPAGGDTGGAKRPRPAVVDIEPSADPGVSLRADAEAKLEDARERLRAAGDTLARDLLTASGERDPLRDALDRVAAAGQGSGTFADGKGFVTGEYTVGPDVGGARTPDGIAGHARLAQTSFDAAYRDGDLSARAHGRGYVGTEASAAAVNGPDGFTANVAAQVGAKATAELDARYGGFTGHTGLKAEAGAGVDGDAALTGQRVRAEGGAYAGARAGIQQTVEYGGLTVGGKAEVWAGAGVRAGLDVGVDDSGKLHLSGEFGAALGAGGSIGGTITVDPEELEQTAREAADAVGRGLRELDGTGARLRSAINPLD